MEIHLNSSHSTHGFMCVGLIQTSLYSSPCHTVMLFPLSKEVRKE